MQDEIHGQGRDGGGATDDYPVRDYIAAMARELARMARWDGDETLGVLQEAAAVQAGEAVLAD